MRDFSMTIQAWKMDFLNSMTFQAQWSPWVTNTVRKTAVSKFIFIMQIMNFKQKCTAVSILLFTNTFYISFLIFIYIFFLPEFDYLTDIFANNQA